MRARELEALTRRSLGQVISWLDGQPLADEGLEGLAKRYADAKAKLGRQTVAGRLGLGEADLAAFDTALRDMVRRMTRLPAEPNAIEDRNALIAELRVLGWLEFFDAKAQDLSLDLTLPSETNEETGRKQVRALELILRSLVDERYQDQEKLIARLKELLSEKVVQQWLASADKGDVLSGTSFSDLASLFVSQQEFPNCAPIWSAGWKASLPTPAKSNKRPRRSNATLAPPRTARRLFWLASWSWSWPLAALSSY